MLGKHGLADYGEFRHGVARVNYAILVFDEYSIQIIVRHLDLQFTFPCSWVLALVPTWQLWHRGWNWFRPPLMLQSGIMPIAQHIKDIDWDSTLKNVGIVVGVALGIFNWWKARDRTKVSVSSKVIDIKDDSITFEICITNLGTKPLVVLSAVSAPSKLRRFWPTHSGYVRNHEIDHPARVGEYNYATTTVTMQNWWEVEMQMGVRLHDGRVVMNYVDYWEVFEKSVPLYLKMAFTANGFDQVHDGEYLGFFRSSDGVEVTARVRCICFHFWIEQNGLYLGIPESWVFPGFHLNDANEFEPDKSEAQALGAMQLAIYHRQVEFNPFGDSQDYIPALPEI